MMMMRMGKLSFKLVFPTYCLIIFLAFISFHGPHIVRAQPLTNQTRLRIAVPPKDGFTQFVKIDRDPRTEELTFGGFAIEVFNQAVAATLDKSFSFEFIPYEKPDGTMNGTYDNMLQAVFDKQYDGAVGDITIRFSRTQWVDFTIAYTVTGLSMLIPAVPQEASSVIMTQNFVTGIFVFFFLSIAVFVGAEIATVVTAKKGEAQNLDSMRRELLGTIRGTRLMILLWLVVMIFLITYYATSLASLLTKEMSSAPAKIGLNQLIRTNAKVGYNSGSFVFDLLKQHGLSEKQLVAYDSETDLLGLFSKGVEQGGIDVAIDETTTLSVFLSRHCNKYTLDSVPSLRSSGYGFAFHKGFQHLQDVSNGIIKITDNGQLGRTQARTIGDLGTCDADANVNGGIASVDNPGNWRAFKACAIVSAVVLVITYAIYFISNSNACLRFLCP